MSNPTYSLTAEQRANVRKLIDALRSGKYRQGRFALRPGDGSTYCCLGVACDLYRLECGGEWAEHSDPIKFEGLEDVLPDVVMGWLGCAHGGFEITIDGERDILSELNDAGYSFGAIADALEQQVLGEKAEGVA